MSIRTTSGLRAARDLEHLLAVGGLADDLDVVLGLEHHLQARADERPGRRRPRRVVIAGASHGRGSRRPVAGPASSSPPNSAARSRMPTMPWPEPLTGGLPLVRAPSSRTSSSSVAAVGDGDARRVRAGRVAQRVGQRLLHDPVGGHVEAGGELGGLAVDVSDASSPAARTCVDELVDAAQRRLRRELGAGVGLAQDAEHAVQLADRLAAGLLDAGERLALAFAGRVAAEQPAHAARLQDHHRDAVGDRVVQLARDPRALLDDRGAGLLLALELDAHDVALGGRAALLLRRARSRPRAPRQQVEAGLRARLRDLLDPAGAEVDDHVGEADRVAERARACRRSS